MNRIHQIRSISANILFCNFIQCVKFQIKSKSFFLVWVTSSKGIRLSQRAWTPRVGWLEHQAMFYTDSDYLVRCWVRFTPQYRVAEMIWYLRLQHSAVLECTFNTTLHYTTLHYTVSSNDRQCNAMLRFQVDSDDVPTCDAILTRSLFPAYAPQVYSKCIVRNFNIMM